MFSSLLLFLFAFSSLVSAALENVTIDDQDFSKIDYEQSRYWAHDPLQGWEYQFYNGSRSYTYTPGAYASFTFTGSGIYLQGPYASDQALRRVWLDGQDMGQYDAYAPERSQCAVFWGKSDLVFTTHTVVVAHNDSAAKIFAVDAFIVEFDPLQTPLPYSTTTVTVSTTTATTTLTSTVTSDPNVWQDLSKHRSYSNVIIGIVVPVLLLLLFCIVGFCIYRNRRSRARQRRRDSFREKIFRARGGFYMQNSAFPFGGRSNSRSNSNSMDERPASPRTIHTIASTQYETAPDHTLESMSRHFHSNNRHLMDIREPSPIQHGAAIHPTLLPSTPGHSIANHTPSGSMALSQEYSRRNSNFRPTFVPPADWRTTLSSPIDLSTDADIDEPASPAALRSSYRQSSMPAPPPSAWHNPERAHHVANRPSTVFSESDSNFSAPQHAAAVSPTTNTRAQTPRDPQRANTMLRRLSAALTSPFTRAPSRASTFMSSGRNSMQQTNPAAPRTSENSGPGYFRGVNHFNLGIPLNYRPVASQSPTDAGFGRQSRAFDKNDLEGGSNSLGRSSTPTTPIRSRSGIEDYSIYGYTQNLRNKTGPASTDRPSTERTIDDDDEKPEKILENFDGSTMRESASGHNRNGSWSVGHGTIADQENGDLGRSGSLSSRQRSFRSRNGQATPPPYTVVVPPDTKATPD